MSPESVELLKAGVAALATVIVGSLTFLGVYISTRKPSHSKPPVGDTGKALDTFNGTQNEFMALVIADNRALREGQEEASRKHDDLERKVEEALAEVRAVKLDRETFLHAVRRYFNKIAAAWGVEGSMPLPDEDDFHLLEDTLPTRPDGRLPERRSNAR